MTEKLTGPMQAALCGAVDAASGKLPYGTNYNVSQALWRRRLVDDSNIVTPYGRAALSDELARRKRQSASAGL